MATQLILYDPVIRAYITEHAVRLVERTASAVETAAKAAAPKETGALADSIHTIMEPGDMQATARVGSELNYAASVHEGTRAHTIEAEPGGVLYLGALGFATEVHHPATRGQPFLMLPLERIAGELGFVVRREHRPG